MPCMCHYHPSDKDLADLKQRCQRVVDKVNELRKIGDPLGGELEDAIALIRHLYDPSSCKERK